MTGRDPGLPAGPCPVSRLATVGGVWAAAFGAAWAAQTHAVLERHGAAIERETRDERRALAWAVADEAVAQLERGRST